MRVDKEGGMTPEEVKQLAEEHWKFLEERERKAFIDGFVHGYKHAQEGEEK